MSKTHILTNITYALILGLGTTPLIAAENHEYAVNETDRLRHESTGVIGGAVIGGALGGPVGAVISAGLGAWVSDLTLSKKENEQLESSLERERRQLTALQAEYRSLQARYQVANRESRSIRSRKTSLNTTAGISNKARDCCNDTEIHLHFMTGSASVMPLYEDRLKAFAHMVKEWPNAVIEITGYADRRGNPDANLALSQQRVQAVEKRLRSHGATNISMQTSAFGESRPSTPGDSLEHNFYDRRVILKVLDTGKLNLTSADD